MHVAGKNNGIFIGGVGGCIEFGHF